MNFPCIFPITIICLVLHSCSTPPPNNLKIGEFRNIEAKERTIEVTGSADMNIEADEIIFSIGIQEYFEEEFQKNKLWQDYKTKVPLKKIEKILFSKLDAIGINRSDITIENIGDQWGGDGRKFNQSKDFNIKVTNFNLIERLTSIEEFKGLQYLKIQELKNKHIEKFRRELKIKALQAAKEKAEYLVESLDKKVGDIVTIKEVPMDFNYSNYYKADLISNRSLSWGPNSNPEEKPNYRSIGLKYDIQATFEIK